MGSAMVNAGDTAYLTPGVEQAGRRPGVRLVDASHGDQRQRDEQQAESGPDHQARTEQSARVAAVLAHQGQPVHAPGASRGA